MEYIDRTYRDSMRSPDLVFFPVKVKESDLYIGVDKEHYIPALPDAVLEVLQEVRRQLEDYILLDPEFKTTLLPYVTRPNAPPIAQEMAAAGWQAGVGPMAAVAGAISEYVGRWLLDKVVDVKGSKIRVKEVLVENGGDIFLKTRKARKIAIFAGQSPFSNRLALEIDPGATPIGICTSSGTVGPSLSFGKADAVVILAPSAALADAAATAVGNLIESANDIPRGIERAKNIEGVRGAVIIKDEKMGAWGDIKLIPL